MYRELSVLESSSLQCAISEFQAAYMILNEVSASCRFALPPCLEFKFRKCRASDSAVYEEIHGVCRLTEPFNV